MENYVSLVGEDYSTAETILENLSENDLNAVDDLNRFINSSANLSINSHGNLVPSSQPNDQLAGCSTPQQEETGASPSFPVVNKKKRKSPTKSTKMKKRSSFQYEKS